MIKLAKLQMPVVAVWFDDEFIQKHGTKHPKDFIHNANQEELVKAMKEDLLKFSDADNAEPLIQFDTSSVSEKQKVFFKKRPSKSCQYLYLVWVRKKRSRGLRNKF